MSPSAVVTGSGGRGARSLRLVHALACAALAALTAALVYAYLPYQIVDVYVRALRRKIGPDRIETVRGAGYRLR